MHSEYLQNLSLMCQEDSSSEDESSSESESSASNPLAVIITKDLESRKSKSNENTKKVIMLPDNKG